MGKKDAVSSNHKTSPSFPNRQADQEQSDCSPAPPVAAPSAPSRLSGGSSGPSEKTARPPCLPPNLDELKVNVVMIQITMLRPLLIFLQHYTYFISVCQTCLNFYKLVYVKVAAVTEKQLNLFEQTLMDSFVLTFSPPFPMIDHQIFVTCLSLWDVGPPF